MDESLYHLHYYQETSHWWFTARARIVRRVLETYGHLEAGDTVLDVGCGAGGFMRALADRYNVVGIDTSPLAVEYTRKRGIDHVFEMRVEDFPKRDFDVRAAVLLDVIEHIEDDVSVLRATREIVRPGGVVVVTVPAYMWLWSAHDVLNHHKRRYTAASLRKSLAAAGLSPMKLTYFNTFLFPLAAARRVIDADEKSDPQRGRTAGVSCAAYDIASPIVNGVLGAIFAAERHILPLADLPFGVSLLAVARVD